MKVSHPVLRREAAALLRLVAAALVIVALSCPAFAQDYGDEGRWSKTEYSMYMGTWPHGGWNDGDPFGGEHGPKTLDISSTITATIRWVKADGVTPAADPPAKVYLLEDATASWSGTDGEGRTVSGEARNGLGHACVARTDGRAGCTSQGKRLVQVDSSSGVITRSVSAVAIANGSSDSTIGNIDVSVSYSLTIDNRGVTITSSLDTTYGEDGNHQSVPNVPDASGTTRADTVKPRPPYQQVTYVGNPIGSWGGPYSYRHWYSSMTGRTWAGSFEDVDAFNFQVSYDSSMNFGAAEHIHLRLRDVQDGAEVTANYYLKFHDPVPKEHWARDPGFPKEHPYPLQPSPANSGDWFELNWESNPTGEPIPREFTVSETGSKSVTGEIGQQVQLGLDEGIVNGSFQINESLTIGKSVNRETSQTISYTIPAGCRTKLYWGWQWREHQGKCCVYGMGGHKGRYTWTAYEPVAAPGGGMWAMSSFPYSEQL